MSEFLDLELKKLEEKYNIRFVETSYDKYPEEELDKYTITTSFEDIFDKKLDCFEYFHRTYAGKTTSIDIMSVLLKSYTIEISKKLEALWHDDTSISDEEKTNQISLLESITKILGEGELEESKKLQELCTFSDFESIVIVNPRIKKFVYLDNINLDDKRLKQIFDYIDSTVVKVYLELSPTPEDSKVVQ